jgi:hypothetical protein
MEFDRLTRWAGIGIVTGEDFRQQRCGSCTSSTRGTRSRAQRQRGATINGGLFEATVDNVDKPKDVSRPFERLGKGEG